MGLKVTLAIILQFLIINGEYISIVDRKQPSDTVSYYRQTCCCGRNNGGETVLELTEDSVKMFFCPKNLDEICQQPSSCEDLLAGCPNAISGYYNITPSNGDMVEVYCDMEGVNCDQQGGWTRVAYLNMTQPGATCPTGLKAFNYFNIDHQLCSKGSSGNGCGSVNYMSPINFTKVCGQVRGYQYGLPDAIGPVIGTGNTKQLYTIDEVYVDGVSITYGTDTRHHLWTYIAGRREILSLERYCPCNRGFDISQFPPPEFVGTNYYCESGNHDGDSEDILYADDPLWDGEQCGGREDTCCLDKAMPWFVRQLNETISDIIEVRICYSGIDEDSPIDILELYVK